MKAWIQDAQLFQDFLGKVMRDGWQPYPEQCPYCGHVKSLHFYFDANPRGLGSFWMWCSNCRRFEHGSVRVPEWWWNLKSLPLQKLGSEPEAVEDEAHSVDLHWQHVGRAARPHDPGGSG